MQITDKMVKAKIEELNKITGQSTEGYTRKEDGSVVANVGTFVLDKNAGGYSLERIMNTSGGVSDILPRGTKRELYNQIKAIIYGFQVNDL